MLAVAHPEPINPKHSSKKSALTDMSKIETVIVQSVEANAQIGQAIDALDAVYDLCSGFADVEGGTLHNVNADHFSSLLAVIIDAMRPAHESSRVRQVAFVEVEASASRHTPRTQAE